MSEVARPCRHVRMGDGAPVAVERRGISTWKLPAVHVPVRYVLLRKIEEGLGVVLQANPAVTSPPGWGPSKYSSMVRGNSRETVTEIAIAAFLFTVSRSAMMTA